MANITDQTIATPQVRDLGGPIPYSNGTATDITNISEGIQAVGNTIMQYRANKVGGELVSAQDNIMSQVSAYQQRVNQITQEMVHADPESFKNLNDELTRIKNGEVQGKMSAQIALLNYHNIAKVYAGRYPFMAGNIRQYSAAFSGELSQMVQTEQADEDPYLKGQKALVTDAGKKGVTPQMLLDEETKKDKAATAISDAQAGAARGKLLQPDIDRAWNNGVIDETTPVGNATVYTRGAAIQYMYNNLYAQFASGKLTKEDTTNALMDMKVRLGDQYRSFLHGLQVDNLQNGGEPILFDNEQDLVNHITQPITELLSVIDKGDQTDEALRTSNAAVALMKNHDAEEIHAVLGPMAWLIGQSSSPLTDLGKVFDVVRDGTRGLGGDYAKLGEVSGQAGLILHFIKDKPAFLNLVANDFSNTLTGDPQKSKGILPPIMIAQIHAGALDYIAGGPDPKARVSQLMNFLNGNNPLTGIAANLPRFTSMIRQSPEVRTTIDQLYNGKLEYMSQHMDLTDLKDIQFQNGLWVYTGTKTRFPNVQLRDTYEAQGLKFSGTDVPYDPGADPRELIKTLNEHQAIYNTYSDILPGTTPSPQDNFASFVESAAKAKQEETQSFSNTATYKYKDGQILKNGKPATIDTTDEAAIAVRQLEISQDPNQRVAAYTLMAKLNMVPSTGNVIREYKTKEAAQEAFTAGVLHLNDVFKLGNTYRVFNAGMKGGDTTIVGNK